MNDGILIVGGYGAVGQVIAAQLAQNHSDQLIIAGRHEARAAGFAARLGARVRWRVLDVAQPPDYETLLADVGCVVMCLDLPQIEFARQIFQRGINYVDISAEYPVLSALKELDTLARQSGTTAVLSVGLVPGLSNLLARHSLRFIDPIQHFDSALVAGMGEKHGVGGSSWVLRHLGDAAGKARFQFREPYRRKTVYRFAFSDQFTLPQTLPIDTAAAWLAFDSFLTTQLITLARLPLLRRLFRQRPVQKILLNSTQRLQFGSEAFVLTTRACGQAGVYQAWLHGQGEARVTGLVTAEVVRQMLEQPPAAGVFHIEQLFELGTFMPALEQNGVVFADASSQNSRNADAEFALLC